MKIVHTIKPTEEAVVEQGKTGIFVFPNTFSSYHQEELTKGKAHLNKTCSCTEYSIQPELEQITFVVKAPEFNSPLTQPYVKEVKPTFTASNGDVIEWDIKFYVK